jgi:beta-barrel assembly-enhancing protease
MPVLPDSSPETKYVQALGKRLVKTIPPDRSWPFQFHVVAQKEINAFALPGGPMFVNVGTITAADNEAELAGVMAHELSHVYMQHSAKQQEKGSLLEGLAGLAGAVAGNMGGTWGTLATSWNPDWGRHADAQIFAWRRNAGRRSGRNHSVEGRIQPSSTG